MKKVHIYILMIVAALFTACNISEPVVLDNPDGRVTVSFNVQYPEPIVVTKTLKDTPDPLSDLWVAVFDGNGYKTEFVKASVLTQDTTDPLKYTYSVTLVASGEPRILHFIGNCPDPDYITNTFGDENTLISSLVTSDGADAYWQRKELMTGIPSDPKDAAKDIGTVDLVRNYAKVTVTSSTKEEEFELEGIKVYYNPDKAYVAPYIMTGAKAGTFVKNYNGIGYSDLVTSFAGYVPSGATLREYEEGDEDTFIAIENGKACDYVYERGNPMTDKADWKKTPTIIIVKGKYNGSETSSYYKINLMDKDDNYYALLRNFNFKINIRKIVNAGYSTIPEAIASAGSGNISTVIGYENVTNISDSEAQMYIDKTSVTVVGSQTIKVKYKFIPDVKGAPGVINNSTREKKDVTTYPVFVTLSEEGEYGPAIEGFKVSASDESDGYRTITIDIAEPDAKIIKKQTLTITGYGWDKDTKTYSGDPVSRSLEVNLRPVLKLIAEATNDAGTSNKIAADKGTGVVVHIGLEDELPKTIFPLNLYIDADQMTLAPAAGQDLPVTSGKCLSGSGKPSYQFVKTLSYDDYSGTTTTKTQDGVTYRMIDCKFVTNAANTSSNIYVTSDLFNLAACGYYTNGKKKFGFAGIEPASVGSGSTTTLSFVTLDTTPVTITLTGATKQGTTDTEFTWTPTNSGIQTVPVTASTYGGKITASLSAQNYDNASATGKRYISIAKGTISANMGSGYQMEPCFFNGSSTANMSVSFGHSSTSAIGNADFTVTRTAGGTENIQVDIPAGSYSVARENKGTDRNPNYYYTYTINITNYNPDYHYSWRTSQSSGTFTDLTPTNVSGRNATFTVGPIQNNSIYLFAQYAGWANLYYRTNGGGNSGRSLSNESNGSGQYPNATKYKYAGTGPESATKLVLDADVTSDSDVLHLFYTTTKNGTKDQTMKISDLVSSEAKTIIFY